MTLDLHRLDAALRLHESRDTAELRSLERCRALLRAHSYGASAALRTSYSPGHLTASAFVVDATTSRLLLIEHRALGRWLQPGGHLEPHDISPLQAARRELEEETSIRDAVELCHGCLFDVDVHFIPARGDVPAHEHFDLRYLFRSAALQASPTHEVRDARWFDITDLDPRSTDSSILRAAARICELGTRVRSV